MPTWSSGRPSKSPLPSPITPPSTSLSNLLTPSLFTLKKKIKILLAFQFDDKCFGPNPTQKTDLFYLRWIKVKLLRIPTAYQNHHYFNFLPGQGFPSPSPPPRGGEAFARVSGGSKKKSIEKCNFHK